MPYYTAVQSIEFQVLSSDAIRAQSVVEIISKIEFNGKTPVDNGLFDLRMGSVDYRNKCKTCKDSIEVCPGHAGHIELATDLYHPGYNSYNTRLLHCVCYFCSRILLHDSDPNLMDARINYVPSERIKQIYKHVKCSKKDQTLCPWCGAPKAKYRKKKETGSIIRTWASNVVWKSSFESRFANLPFTAKIVKRILFGISDRDFAILGLKPDIRDSILNCLSVPPPRIRPMQNDLTIKLSKIVEVNEALKQLIVKKNWQCFLDVEATFLERYRMSLISSVLLLLVCIQSPVKHSKPGLVSHGPRQSNEIKEKKLKEKETKKVTAKRRPTQPLDIIDKHTRVLQYQVSTFFNNEKKAAVLGEEKTEEEIKDNNNNAKINGNMTRLKTLAQRLKGKEGRFRSNLSGKRVDWSGRCCIVPDGSLDLDQAGIPTCIAIVLTIQDTVTPFNIRLLTDRVRAGYGLVHGAKSVWDSHTKKTKELAYFKDTRLIVLKLGDKVYRYLQNNDIVLLNRQPSLHKQSIMAHRVKIVAGHAIRLNGTVCTPYNADFDGDEMNVHVCQSFEARAEAMELMAIDKQVMNAQNNKPLFGFKQDALVGWYLACSQDTFFTREYLMELMMNIQYANNFESSTPNTNESLFDLPVPAILKPVSLWTGKQIFSMLLPKDLNYSAFTRKLKAVNENVGTQPDSSKNNVGKTTKSTISIHTHVILDSAQRCVIVQNGELLCGTACSSILGSSKKSLFHALAANYDGKKFVRFVSDAQRIINSYLLTRGLSVGASDLLLSGATLSKIQLELETSLATVGSIQLDIAKQNKTAHDVHKLMVSLEPSMIDYLTSLLLKSGSFIEKNIDRDNPIAAMVISGSKGNLVNLYQMLVVVGQNSVSGKRLHPIKDLWPGYDLLCARSLPCFESMVTPYFVPEASGFVKHSYMFGLSADEFFFQAMAGLKGLVDTATKASDIGYSYRKVVKAAESIAVEHDGTVRDLNRNNIVQFTYGTDGLDGACMHQIAFPPLCVSDEFLYGQGITKEEIVDLSVYKQKLLASRDTLVEKSSSNESSSSVILVSVDMHRQIEMFLRSDYLIPANACDAFPNSILLTTIELETLDRWFAQAMYATDSDLAEVLFQIKSLFLDSLRTKLGSMATLHICSALAWFFCFQNWSGIVQASAFHKQTQNDPYASSILFAKALEHIIDLYFKSRVHAGEAVGALAASSIAEPLSQLTFNTFHYAGVAVKNVTSGFPRLSEIFQGSNDIRTPSTVITLQSENAPHNAIQSVPVVYFHQLFEKGRIVKPRSSVKSGRKVSETWTVPSIGNCCENELDMSTVKLVYQMKASVLQKLNLSKDEILNVLRDLFGRYHIYVDLVEYKAQGTSTPSATTQTAQSTFQLTLQIIHEKSLLSLGGGGTKESTSSDSAKVKQDHGISTSALQFIQTFLGHNLPLQGIPGITQVVPRPGTLMVDTNGTSSCMSLLWLLDTVDWRNTISNDIQEVYATMGVECAAYLLFHEIRAVLSAMEGSGIDDRHILLLVDIMTCSGILMPLNRHGYKTVNHSVFQQASFEKQTDVLHDAAFTNTFDFMQGISSSIFLGQSDMVKMGTGLSHVIYLTPDSKHDPCTSTTTARKSTPTLETITTGFSQDSEIVQEDTDEIYKRLERIYLPLKYQCHTTTTTASTDSSTQRLLSNAKYYQYEPSFPILDLVALPTDSFTVIPIPPIYVPPPQSQPHKQYSNQKENSMVQDLLQSLALCSAPVRAQQTPAPISLARYLTGYCYEPSLPILCLDENDNVDSIKDLLSSISEFLPS